jgi:hypothetical protein
LKLSSDLYSYIYRVANGIHLLHSFGIENGDPMSNGSSGQWKKDVKESRKQMDEKFDTSTD